MQEAEELGTVANTQEYVAVMDWLASEAMSRASNARAVLAEESAAAAEGGA
jgi:hypothetical protein